MPKLQETTYQDILKVEFKDMLRNFLDGRERFHAYSIGRLMTHGTMLGFQYHYFIIDDTTLGKQMVIPDYGLITFKIDCETSYGVLTSPNRTKALINKFLEEFDVSSQLKTRF